MLDQMKGIRTNTTCVDADASEVEVVVHCKVGEIQYAKLTKSEIHKSMKRGRLVLSCSDLCYNWMPCVLGEPSPGT